MFTESCSEFRVVRGQPSYYHRAESLGFIALSVVSGQSLKLSNLIGVTLYMSGGGEVGMAPEVYPSCFLNSPGANPVTQSVILRVSFSKRWFGHTHNPVYQRIEMK